MVGLKSIWITMSALFLLAACVPQTKQTACDDNESYNSSLRTCVPTVNSPSSFITISSFIPSTTYSRFKNDVTPMTFRVNISNPYEQSFSTRWIRTYNGQSTDVTSIINSPTQWDIFPLFFVNEVGLHQLTVDILDSSSNIVDTHGFQFTINNSPRPFIDTTSSNTTSTNPLITNPTQPTTVFSISIKNNGSTIPSTSTYRTDWSIINNGVVTTILAPDNATENFTDITSNGTNTSDLNFNPNLTTGYGLGSFVIRARVIYTPGNEVVDERQWFANVEVPAKKKVTARRIIEGSGLNPDTRVNAYVDVDYNTSTTYNFRPITTDSSTSTALVLNASQADFCVRVADGSGTYPDATDSLGVKVSWYLNDAGGALYEATTTTADPEVCLTDVGNTNLNTVFFNSVSDNHKITARLVDEATNLEYTSSDVNAGVGGYPVTWNIKVREQNAAPLITFGSISSGLTSCMTSGSNRNCTIDSDTVNIVSIVLSRDDFYILPTYDSTKFNYSIGLYQNNILIQECTPTDAGEDGFTDLTATDRFFQCAFNAPGFDSTGPIDPTTANYKILATVTDTQSEITTDTATSNVLTWNFTVRERNASLGAVLNGPGTANEGANAAFSIDVTDLEVDDFIYRIKYCTNDACTTTGNLTTVLSHDRTTDTNPINIPVSQFLTEDFLNNVSGTTACASVARNASCAVQFFVEVTDDPTSATVASRSVTTVSTPTSVTITNINPDPTFNEASFSPVAAIGFSNMVGIPFTIQAPIGSAVLDSSAVTSEQVNRFQWFVKQNSVATWTPISGATSQTLVWTPSLIDELNLGTDNPVQLKLCIEDRSLTLVPSILVDTNAALCTTGLWETTVRNNVSTVQSSGVMAITASGATNLGRETAVWYDAPSTINGVTSSQVFTVYVDSNNDINVKRSLLSNTGEIIPDGATFIATFEALDTGATADVRDLSVTGNDNELYIAYRASPSTAPAAYFPQVRRIDIAPGKIAPNNNTGKYGFSYTGIVVNENCSISAECTVTNPGTGAVSTVRFAPSVTMTGDISITTGTGTRVYAFNTTALKTVTEICGDCAANAMASSFATAINADTTLEGMGITATVSGDTVTIHGSTALDFVNGQTVYNQVADDMGDIYIDSGKWHLPFINSSLGGANKDKISAITGNIGGNMTLIAGQTQLNSLSVVALSNMATTYANGFLYVAGLAKSGSAVKLYQMTPSTLALTGVQNLSTLTDASHTDIEIAASTSNVFVATTTLATPVDNYIGIYSAGALGETDKFKLSETTNVDAATQAVFNGTDIKSLRLVPYGTEARLVAAAESPSNGVQLFMARIHLSGTDWIATCKECVQVTDTAKEVGEYVRINVSPVRTKSLIGTDFTLGSVGATANQNKKDIFMTSFAGSDDTTATAEPHLGVFNIELEQINSTSLDTTAPDAGLFRPPFFKN